MKQQDKGVFHTAKQPETSVSHTVDRLLEEALAHHRLGQLSQAGTLYRQILQLSPEHRQALHWLGLTAHQAGKYTLALELIDTAILLKPDFAEAYSDRGNVLERLGRYEAAVESFDTAILLKPDFAEAYNNRGNALLGLRQYQVASASFDAAILLKPMLSEAYSNRGNALHQLRQYQAAVESFDEALRLRPDFAQAWANRGSALTELQQDSQALESFDKAILLKLDNAEIWSNRGKALHGLQQYEAALQSCDRAILLKPDFAEAHNNRGNALHGLWQYEAACDSFATAVLLKPGYAAAWNNRGNALVRLQQTQAAVESFNTAIHIQPDYAAAYGNRGIILLELHQYRYALESFDEALRLKPDYALIAGQRLHVRQLCCDWDNIERECRRLVAQVERGERVATPFVMLGISSSAAVQKKTAEIFPRDKYGSCAGLSSLPRCAKRDKIRIGYFSADFYNHATCYLMAELFERHDRSKFEIIGFSYGPDIQDGMRQRVVAAMDRFVDVRSLPDRSVSQLSRELKVDIAVDLKGFTANNREGIFAGRAAPIQINYLGYPGTMGAESIDYLIADQTLVPEASQQHYSEKIVYLPGSYQVNDSQRRISDRPWARAKAGLPEKGFVYCCFNNNWKIAPNTFDIWMRILKQVEGSVLWLLEGNPWAGGNLRKEAARRGVSPERLIFAQRLPLADHLARHSLADLFLDTLPCNAHTTASDALWAGLPLLTCMGEAFASRVGASLLRAIELPELVTTTQTTYESLAIELAFDGERCQEIRRRLQRNRLSSPLFDFPGYTRHLEAAYSAMYERYQANLLPDHIHIAGGGAREQTRIVDDRIRSESPDFHRTLAKSLRTQQRFREAAESFRRVIELQPSDLQAHLGLGATLHEAGELSAASAAYVRMVQWKPDCAEAWTNLGLVCQDLGDLALAVDMHRQAIALAPEMAEAHNNLGSVFSKLGNPEDALTCFQSALQLEPDHAGAHYNMGYLCQNRGDVAAAEQCYRRALACHPQSETLRYYLGMLHLMQGKFSAGWAEYESRWGSRQLREGKRRFAQPQWRGESLHNKSILLYGEQGLGDTMQFVRYAPLVTARGGRVILEVQPELRRLISGMEGVAQVLSPGEALPKFSWQCPLMSLPLAFGTELASIPSSGPYLHAGEGDKAAWSDRLSVSGLRIGLVWGGSPQNPRDGLRSIPLEELAPLTAIPRTHFYSLQKGPPARQIKTAPAGMRITDLEAEQNDFTDTAAIVAGLDLVISCDTSVAHLAGALGKPVWILLHHMSDWRWLLDREDSPWYPSARLFRKSPAEGWPAVIDRMRGEIDKLATTKSLDQRPTE